MDVAPWYFKWDRMGRVNLWVGCIHCIEHFTVLTRSGYYISFTEDIPTMMIKSTWAIKNQIILCLLLSITQDTSPQFWQLGLNRENGSPECMKPIMGHGFTHLEYTYTILIIGSAKRGWISHVDKIILLSCFNHSGDADTILTIGCV